MESVYEIIDNDIDGSGSYIRMYVASDNVLNQDEEALLKECLDDAKEKASDEDWDTEDMVSEAIEMFRAETGKELSICGSPFLRTITF